MAQGDILRLILPNDLNYLHSAQNFVRDAATLFGLAEGELFQLEIGIEEAVTNVMKHAYDAEENRFFEIACESIPAGIKVVIKEKGIPFDPGQIPRYTSGTTPEDFSSKGLGSYLMHQMLDEVSYHNLGLGGKETHLVKYRKDKATIESEIRSAQETMSEPAVIREKVAYDVRGLQPGEAIQIAKCAYQSHGYSFFDDHIYYPERLIHMNETGEMISAVAVTKDNVFMGHAALLYQYPEDKCAELTFVFVNVEYRGQGAFNRLIEYLFACPKRRELQGVYAYAVANHVFTQKAMMRYQINDCGLLLATSPASWRFKGIAGDGDQRISVVLSYKYTGPVQKLRLYPPAHHRAMIEKLYRNIGAREHEYRDPDPDALSLAEDSEILTGINEAEGCAEIFVSRYGRDVVRDVRRLLRKFCVKQIACINVFLNLEDPATALMTAEIESLGFFFAGILPHARIGDTLILQYLNNVDLDYARINVYSDMAKEILAYIKERDPNEAI